MVRLKGAVRLESELDREVLRVERPMLHTRVDQGLTGFREKRTRNVEFCLKASGYAGRAWIVVKHERPVRGRGTRRGVGKPDARNAGDRGRSDGTADDAQRRATNVQRDGELPVLHSAL